jgi:leader peptidase (prepilin peptidase) / N-methyltransferase
LFDKTSIAGHETGFVARAVILVLRTSAQHLRVVAAHYAWGAVAVCSMIASLTVAPGIPGAMGAALAVTMIAIAAVDARSFTIPDKLVLVGLLLGFLNAAIVHEGQVTAGLINAALRGGAFALLFLCGRSAYRLVRGREGIGLGDVKLAAVAGAWLDWMSISVAVDVAALSALAAVLVHAIRGRPISIGSAIPFGLFFAPAIWLAWFLKIIGGWLIG